MTRLEIYRLIRDHGPVHVSEIIAAFPGRSEQAIRTRLSELYMDGKPGMQIRRICRGIYDVRRT